MSYDLSVYLKKATADKWAIPHFNVCNLEQLRAVANAAAELRAPVMIGTSEGERALFTPEGAAALVAAYEEKFCVPLFLNADHTKNVASAKAAIEAGYSSVHIDLSKLSFAENTKGVAEVVRYARKQKRKISIEGELGALATDSSTVLKSEVKIDPATFTSPEQALEFVHKTGIDRLAPAVGNYHGISKTKKNLDFARIKDLRAKLRSNVALVLHGGSGSGDAAFKKAIRAGIANIHISTELRVAYTKTLRETMKKNPDEVIPYKLTAPATEAVKKKAMEFIKLFGANGKA
ncbi:MAG: class II fructose-bisphosphate aldolase [Desulfobacteraceae bacterium]|nr:MAG: class II fructose-bisphosphate aldolase [Desulfobacteraceae bacterium]